MNTIILILFGITIATALVITLVTVIRARSNRDSAEAEQEAYRTPEQKARDRQTAIIWAGLLIAVPTVLVLAYTLTR